MTQLISKRSVRTAVPALLLLTAMTVKPDPYKNIGEGRFTKDCTPPGASFTTKCQNIPRVDLLQLSTASERTQAALWIQSRDRKWGPQSATSYRSNGQEFKIESNKVLKWVALKKINAWNPNMIVVARISADSTGPTDARYNIGMQPGYTMSKYFYMAVREYDISDVTEKLSSRKVSMWSTYGIATPNGSTEPQLVLLAQGVFRWCAMEHWTADDESYAEFINCEAARAIQLLETPPVHTILKGRSLLKTFVAEIDSVTRAGTDTVERTRKNSVARRSVSATQARVSLSPAILTLYTRAVGTAEGTLGFALGAESVAQLFQFVSKLDLGAPAWVTCGGGCCIAESLLM